MAARRCLQAYLLLIFAASHLATPSRAVAAAVAGQASLEEVIVTARRRSENIQDTPIAVSAISGEELRERGIGNVRDLSKMVPSLEITKNRTSSIFIRGVGERTGFARVDPAVGVYLDDLFLPRADGQLLDTVDVSSIQVLRGPQGTLFGKNTTGGAMVLTLQKPHDSFEAYFDIGLGNLGLHKAKASINFPITDNLFVKIAGNTIEDDGYISDELIGTSNGGDNDRQSLLAQARWDISDSLGLDAFAYYGRVREQIPTDHCNVINRNSLFMNGLYVMWEGDTQASNPSSFNDNCESNSREKLGDFKTRMGANPYMTRDLETAMLSSALQWEATDNHSLKVVMGVREAVKGPQWLGDNDGGPKNLSEAYGISFLNPSETSSRDSLSLELQLNGSNTEETLNYTIGLFGMRETNKEPFSLFTALAGLDDETLVSLANGQSPNQPTLLPGTPFVGTLNPQSYSQFGLENKTFAVFGQLSYQVTDQIEFTTGLRYTSEDRSADLTVYRSDVEAVGLRMMATGLFGPGVGGLHPYLDPRGWLADPVGFANSLFPDVDGDSIPDFPFELDTPFIDSKAEKFSKKTPMASLAYSFNGEWLADSVIDSGLLYGTWSIGFKSGFFEPRGVDGLERVEPETVENREIGLKLETFGRTLRANMALYSMDFDNMQLIQVKQDSAGNNAVIFQNAARASIVGGEIEIQWIPIAAMSVNFALSHNIYSFKDYKDRDLLAQALGQGIKLDDRSDEPFPVSPRDIVSLGIQYRLETELGRITPRFDVGYRSERFFGIDNGSYDAYRKDVSSAGDEAYTVIDLRLGWTNVEGDRSVSFYVNNAADERYLSNSGAVGDSIGTNTGSLAPPRTYGVDVRFTY